MPFRSILQSHDLWPFHSRTTSFSSRHRVYAPCCNPYGFWMFQIFTRANMQFKQANPHRSRFRAQSKNHSDNIIWIRERWLKETRKTRSAYKTPRKPATTTAKRNNKQQQQRQKITEITKQPEKNHQTITESTEFISIERHGWMYYGIEDTMRSDPFDIESESSTKIARHRQKKIAQLLSIKHCSKHYIPFTYCL